MIPEYQSCNSNIVVADWLAALPVMLSMDAVNLCQIVSAGRFDFELTDQELVDFVSQSVRTLLESGAVPVVGNANSQWIWAANFHFGKGKEEIIGNVVREWVSSNNDDDYPWTVWFALPNPQHVKFD